MPNGNTRRWFFKTGMAACIFFLAPSANAQQVQTITDKKDILIGEQFTVKFKAGFPEGTCRVNWPAIPDSIPHFEIINKGKLDSSKENGNTILEQRLLLTSFDSGKWTFPSFLINLDPVKDDTTFSFFTDSLLINVSYSPADTSGQLRDIKPIMGVTVTDYTLYYVAGGIVLLLLALFFLYRYFKKNKKEKPNSPVSKLSAYEEAMAALKELERSDLQDAPSIKAYHTKLADIFRTYLSRSQQKNLLTKTTGDILVRMNESGMASGHISDLATALRCTDAVKFAKYLPATLESQDCLQRIRSAIELMKQQT